MEWLVGTILANKILAGQVFVMIMLAVLPPKQVRQVGFGIGKAVSLFLRQKAGVVAGEKVEGYIQGTANEFLAGVNEGMDKDDHVAG